MRTYNIIPPRQLSRAKSAALVYRYSSYNACLSPILPTLIAWDLKLFRITACGVVGCSLRLAPSEFHPPPDTGSALFRAARGFIRRSIVRVVVRGGPSLHRAYASHPPTCSPTHPPTLSPSIPSPATTELCSIHDQSFQPQASNRSHVLVFSCGRL